MPSVAQREWDNAPCGLLETIIEFRAFATAKRIVDTAESAKDIPQKPMFQLVKVIEFEHVAAQLKEKAERAKQAEQANG